MISFDFEMELLEKLTYAERDTNAIPAYTFNEIEPVIEKQLAALRERLEKAEALVTKWRKDNGNEEQEIAMVRCADELKAALESPK